jgi:metal-sulfur cluster biosynthetic enzyme
MSDPLRTETDDALANVIDPELGIDIVSLGLIYGVGIESRRMDVLMTPTPPAVQCTERSLPASEQTLRQLSWVNDVRVQIRYRQPWTAEMLTPKGRILLGR